MTSELAAQVMLGLKGVPYQVQGGEEFKMAALTGAQARGPVHVLQDKEPSLRLVGHAENTAPEPLDSQVIFRWK